MAKKLNRSKYYISPYIKFLVLSTVIVVGSIFLVTNQQTVLGTTTNNTCKVGVNSFAVTTSCGNSRYRHAKYKCYDGSSGILGVSSSCKEVSVWYKYVQATCKGKSSCSVTPTRSVTPTPVRPTPTQRPLTPTPKSPTPTTYY